MLRLVGLREALEGQHVTAYEMKLLCCRDKRFLKLAKVLPYARPAGSLYDLYGCLSLCGVKPEYMNRHQVEDISHMKMKRMRDNIYDTNGYILEPSVVQDSYDNYMVYARNFWFTILKPLQLQYVPEDLSIVTDYWKFCILWKFARTAILTKIFIEDKEIMDGLAAVQSLPKFRIGDLMKDCLAPTDIMRMFGATNKNPRQWTSHTEWDRVEKVYEQSKNFMYKVYNFIMKVQCLGYLNDSFMEGEYEYILAERYGYVPDAGDVEQPTSEGSIDL